MMGNLEDLANHRNALLLAEVAAWLHMFGKLSEEFLGGNTSYSRRIPTSMRDDFPVLFELIKDSWVGDVWKTLPLIGLGAENLSIRQLIESHEKDPQDLPELFRKLLIDAHGRGSGSEKGKFGQFTKPHSRPVYSSTAFGNEIELKTQSIKTIQNNFYIFLQDKLTYLKDHSGSLTQNNWEFFRSSFIKEIWAYFSSTVADNRRPINDVTLFDQTALSVAFFKAALAQPLLSLEGLVRGRGARQQVVIFENKARLLRVALDGPAFWGNAVRISDLKARNEIVRKALDKVRLLIEVEYPLGFEIYRDENGSMFIVPDVEDLLSFRNKHSSLLELIKKEVEGTLNYEAIPEVLPLSPPMRMTLSLKPLMSAALPPLAPSASWVAEQWEGKLFDVCPVCGLRPQGSLQKSKDRGICDICSENRQKRSNIWIGKLEETIWIDEVADDKGSVALIMGQFSILDWLDGKFLSTIPVIDIKDGTLIERENNQDIAHQFNFNEIDEEFYQGLATNGQFKDFVMINDLKPPGIDETASIRDFYSDQVLNTDLKPEPLEEKPHLLTLSLIRRTPNPARIHRTWRTTKAFWKERVSDFKSTIGEVSPRLRIQGKFTPQEGSRNTLGISHTYELKLVNTNLSITYIGEGEFLTVDNLRRTANLAKQTKEYSGEKDEIQKSLQAAQYLQEEHLSGKSLTVEEPTGYRSSKEAPIGYGSPNTIRGTLQITKVTPESIPYVPAITILTEPRTFMVLVPADKALKVADDIKEKYETEMGKVRNRLPLTLGIVFAGKRTPLPAILDAGRRMLRQPPKDERWKIKHTSWKVKVADNQYTEITDPGYPRPSWPIEIALALVKEDQSLEDQQPQKIKIRTVMRDQTTPDVWYPYWCLEQEVPNAKKRERMFKSVDGKPWVHVTDLQKGDIVSFMPSRLDFEFLDTASRRFEVSYENTKRRGNTRFARPYYLEQLKHLSDLWEMLSNRLATTQIDTLVHLIETKRQGWLSFFNQDEAVFKEYKPTFDEIVFDIIKNANWREGKRPTTEQIRDFLRPAAISGQLADVANLYMSILKKKTVVDEQMEGKQ